MSCTKCIMRKFIVRLLSLSELAYVFCLQGRRALDFVLKNQGLIDKTLLFDIELVRVL